MRNIFISLLVLVAFSTTSFAQSKSQLKKSCNELFQPINESVGEGAPIIMRLEPEAFTQSFNATSRSEFKSYWNDRQKASYLHSIFKSWNKWRLTRLRKKTLSQQPSHQMKVALDATELAKTETWQSENSAIKDQLFEQMASVVDKFKNLSQRIQLLYLKGYVHYASYRLLKNAYDYHLPTEDTPLSIQNFPVVEMDENGQGRLAFQNTVSYQNRFAIKSDMEKHKDKWRSLLGYIFKKGEVGALEAEQAQLREDLKTYRWAFNDAVLENRFVEGLSEPLQEIKSLLDNDELRASPLAALSLLRKMREVESSRLQEIDKGKDSLYEEWVDQLAAASEGVVEKDSIEKALEEIGFEKVRREWQERYNRFKDSLKKQVGSALSRVVSATIYTTVAVTIGGAAASQWDKLSSSMQTVTDGIVDRGIYALNWATDYSFAIDRIVKSDNFEMEKSIFIDTYFPDIKVALLTEDANSEALNSERAQELREILLDIEWQRFEYLSEAKQALLSEKEREVQKLAYEKMLQDLLAEVNYLNIRMIFMAIEGNRTDAQAHTFIDYLRSVSDEDIDLRKAEALMRWYQSGVLALRQPPEMTDFNLNTFLGMMLDVRKSYEELIADNPEMSRKEALTILLQDEGYKPFVFGQVP